MTLTRTRQSPLYVQSLVWHFCLVSLVRSTAYGMLGTQAHPFFAGIGWDALASTPAPYVPTVTHELDTQNFEEFEVKGPASESMSARRRLRADPNFIGYTYKNWEAVSPREGVPCLPPLCGLAACFVSRTSVIGYTYTLSQPTQRCSMLHWIQQQRLMTLDSITAHEEAGHLLPHDDMQGVCYDPRV